MKTTGYIAERHHWSAPIFDPRAACDVRLVRVCDCCGAIQATSTAYPGWGFLDLMDEEQMPRFCRPAPAGPSIAEMREMGVEP